MLGVMRILIIAALILFLVMWVRAVIGLFQRHDISGSAKAAWAIFMLVIPFLGLLIYTLMEARPPDASRR